MSIRFRTGWRPTTPATTSRSRSISTATVLRMAFAISRKSGHSSRARWLYQLRTTTAKESSMRHLKFVVNCALVFSSMGAFAQDSARTVQYHSQDIVPIRAKVKYTTLIELPTTEKIMEAATGDKEFWIVDVVGNFCFVHPAKQGISSNLNLITDKGNIYSFTLQDISALSTTPDLKVIVEPADRSAIVAASGPPQFVPAAQLEQSRQQLAALQSHVEHAVDEYKSAYPTRLKFDYAYKANLVTYDLREGTYIIPKIMDSGYVELGKKRMEFTRKGSPS